MGQKKGKKPKAKFKGLFVTAPLLEQKNISAFEKLLLTDICCFRKNGRAYDFTHPALAKKFGVCRRTVIRSIERLSGSLEMIENIGGKYSRDLRLTDKAAAFFSDMKAPEPEGDFVPPENAAEVEGYATSIGYTIDGQRFIGWYAERDWFVGKNKMSDWRAAVRTWKKRDENRNGKPNKIEQVVTAEPFIR